MSKYVSLVNLRLGNFAAWGLEHILRDSNEKADVLATVAASLPIKETVLLLVYYQPGKRNRRSVSFLDDSNSQLFELGRTAG